MARDAVESDTRRIRRCGTRVTEHSMDSQIDADPDKAAVLEWIGQMVADGLAECSYQAAGEIHVRFLSGETFLLLASGMLRLA